MGFFGLGPMEILVLGLLGLFWLAALIGVFVALAVVRSRRANGNPREEALRAEVERLRAEVERLKDALAAAGAPPSSTGIREPQ
jgi:hypothetical protein